MGDDWNDGQQHDQGWQEPQHHGEQHHDEQPGTVEDQQDPQGDGGVEESFDTETVEVPVGRDARTGQFSWSQIAAMLNFQSGWRTADQKHRAVFRAALNVEGDGTIDVLRRLYPSEGRWDVYQFISSTARKVFGGTLQWSDGMAFAQRVVELDQNDFRLLIAALNGLGAELVGDAADQLKYRRNLSPNDVVTFLVTTLEKIKEKDPSVMEYFTWIDGMLEVWPGGD